MLKLVADNNVKALLSSLGFASDADDSNEITIDRFDHWTNRECADWIVATCGCGAVFADAERAAA